MQTASSGCADDLFPRPGYEHLKRAPINLNELNLTDKQLIAVSLVFYGGPQTTRRQGNEDQLASRLRAFDRGLEEDRSLLLREIIS